MASRATVRRQLSEIRASGKWRQLGFLERSVWLHLYAEAADATEPGRIEFLGPFLPSLAQVLDLAEPEVERAVAVLRDARLVELDAEGRAAWLPGARVVTSSRKAEASRANGRRGGRPKNLVDPRQGFMVHEVRGLAARGRVEPRLQPRDRLAPRRSCLPRFPEFRYG